MSGLIWITNCHVTKNTNKRRQNILVQLLQWFKIQGRLQYNSCPRADLVGMSPSDLGQLPMLLCWILYLFVSYVIHSYTDLYIDTASAKLHL